MVNYRTLTCPVPVPPGLSGLDRPTWLTLLLGRLCQKAGCAARVVLLGAIPAPRRKAFQEDLLASACSPWIFLTELFSPGWGALSDEQEALLWLLVLMGVSLSDISCLILRLVYRWPLPGVGFWGLGSPFSAQLQLSLSGLRVSPWSFPHRPSDFRKETERFLHVRVYFFLQVSWAQADGSRTKAMASK